VGGEIDWGEIVGLKGDKKRIKKGFFLSENLKYLFTRDSERVRGKLDCIG